MPHDGPFESTQGQGSTSTSNIPIPLPLVDHYAPLIGPHALAVYLYLARIANDEGWSFPSLQSIATATGMSRKTALKSTRILEEHRLIDVYMRNEDDGGRLSNLYVLRTVEGER